MDYAVIGTGPAAYAAIEALLANATSGDTVLLVGMRPDPPRIALEGRDPRSWTPDEADALHRALKARGGRGFPPPRSRFGDLPEHWPGSHSVRLFRSDRFGGLGNFWSRLIAPFAPGDFRGWPFGYDELEPYYRKVAECMGISGVAGEFQERYPDSFVNRPPVAAPPLLETLVNRLGTDRDPDYRIHVGHGQIAVETRDGRDDACVYCGGCFYGCFRGALFDSGARLEALIARGRIRFLDARVERVVPGPRVGIVLRDGTRVDVDRVFLGAGAIGTSEIVLRSFGRRGVPVYVDDNEMYNFPILYLGPRLESGPSFPISTKVAVLVPAWDRGPAGEIKFAPLPTILFDYYLPARMARRLRPVTDRLRQRMVVAQLYVDGATAARHALYLDRDNVLRIENVRRHHSDFRARRMIRALRRNLAGTPFLVPPFPLTKVSSSAHYVGGFSFGSQANPIDALGQVLDGVHIIDSAAFPNTPSQTLTFTIMAYAWRTAERVHAGASE